MFLVDFAFNCCEMLQFNGPDILPLSQLINYSNIKELYLLLKQDSNTNVRLSHENMSSIERDTITVGEYIICATDIPNNAKFSDFRPHE